MLNRITVPDDSRDALFKACFRPDSLNSRHQYKYGNQIENIRDPIWNILYKRHISNQMNTEC